MPNRLIVPCLLCALTLGMAGVKADSPLDYDFQIAIERSALEGLSLGENLAEDRLVEEILEFELKLEYEVDDNWFLFFSGTLFDEKETTENSGLDVNLSGLERTEIGAGVFFGDVVESEMKFGRMEFDGGTDWWLWWDEELDGIQLKSHYGDFEAMLGLTEELARESTAVDFIDPELDGVKRIILDLGWEFASTHSLNFYYLDQNDDSSSLVAGELQDVERIDEEDADLTWAGISYLGDFDLESFGFLELQLHSARVSGDETLYEFDDPEAGRAEVAELTKNRVSGTAQAFLLSWSPGRLEDWQFFWGNASGSGDADPDDNRNKSFRQNSLQGDSESFGELYQPELSNLEVGVLGVRWYLEQNIHLALMRFDYEQNQLAEEMRDVSVDLELTGSSRDLGQETDLIVTIEAADGLELILTLAEFNPGKAYGDNAGETSNFLNFEMTYEF